MSEMLVKHYSQKNESSAKNGARFRLRAGFLSFRCWGTTGGACRINEHSIKKYNVKTMEPRTHHTIFTYKILPGLFFEDPVGLLFLLTDTENQGQGIVGLWMQVGKDLLAQGHGLVSPAGLGAAKAAIWGEHAVVVQLPGVQAPGEADFVAMLSQQGRPVFLSFERLEDPDAEDGLGEESVLCGWTAAGEHVSYELYGPPELEHFLSLVEKLLQEARG